MRQMAFLDVTGVTANNYDSNDLPTGFTSTKCNTLYVINVSNLCYTVTFTGGSGMPVVGHLPNNWSRPFKVNGNYDRYRIVGANNPANAATPAFSHIVVESYLPSEDTTHLSDTAIPNPQQNIGGAVTTATNLINDGNTAGTTIVESTQAGASGSDIIIKNDGTVNIAQYQAGVLTQLFSIVPGTIGNGSSRIFIGNIGNNVNIVDQMSVSGVSSFNSLAFFNAGWTAQSNGVVTNIIPGAGATALQINGSAGTPQGINFTGANLGNPIHIDASTVSTGIDMSGMGPSNAIALKLLAGSISRIKFGFISVVTTGTVITHGLGAVPQGIFVNNASATAGVTFVISAIGATTFTVTPTSNVNCYWLAVFA